MTTTTTQRPRSTDFAELGRRITGAGLLTRKPGYYTVRLSVVALMLVGGWVAFFLIGASWWTSAVAAFLAVTFAQVALVAHDLAHRQVFRTQAPSARAGMIAGNLAIGMSYGYWQDKHTRHHANPNHDDLDPDVAPAVLVWSQDAARTRRGRMQRWLTRNQAWLFFPLLTLLGLSLHKDSIKALLNGSIKRRGWESVLLAAHLIFYVTALVTVLQPLQALTFFVIHQGLFGVYLGLTFAPNHKGMPHPTGDEDFLRKQVLTSRNVRGGRLTDIALGGLNYQIEHHLFPAMPTRNLRRAQPIVRAYCREIGVTYEETGLIESYGIALKHLHEVGEPLR
ncbi:acyl-CoA desaturase [Actinoplanes sp. TFC3]|uniref:fatty acid desaturase family protein n=1 Tax=Actinoplanes sp. TFC3 TaxID=1710355 RepID=UPI000836F552|nr:acyl-CoA desaturase [Actinoplanes sp. TFC3]